MKSFREHVRDLCDPAYTPPDQIKKNTESETKPLPERNPMKRSKLAEELTALAESLGLHGKVFESGREDVCKYLWLPSNGDIKPLAWNKRSAKLTLRQKAKDAESAWSKAHWLLTPVCARKS